MTQVHIGTVTVGAGGAASIDFTGIPQTGYTDLKLVVSLRDAQTSAVYNNVWMRFNGVAAGYYERLLFGGAGVTNSYTGTNAAQLGFLYGNGSTGTTNTWGSGEIYISNYSAATNKFLSIDTVTEQNSSTSAIGMDAGLWSNTAAVTSISIFPGTATTWVAGSTASLYGISNVNNVAKATGGSIMSDGSYIYHVFKANGTFTPTAALSVDILAIAGGGGGGSTAGGGGGAGGVLGLTSQVLAASGHAITVGAGGAGGAYNVGVASPGENSVVGTAATAIGGGRGSIGNGVAGGTGGSGGGGTPEGGAAGAATAGQGNAGGAGYSGNGGAGGGGGAGTVGANGTVSSGGSGGSGTTTYTSWGYSTNTGHNVSGTYYFGGGGGGAMHPSGTAGSGGLGGGGAASPYGSYGAGVIGTAGTPNTGGGGGAGSGQAGVGYAAGANGGSGVVIIRYPK